MDVKSLYDAGKLSDSQMVRLVRLGTLGNKLGITVDEFEEINFDDEFEGTALGQNEDAPADPLDEFLDGIF